MTVLLTYDDLTLDSSEILNIDIKSGFNVGTTDTVNDKQITQPGNVTPITIEIEAKLTNNVNANFRRWRDKPRFKPLYSLDIFNSNWGGYYLEKVDIKINELDENGDVLRCRMNLSFIQNQNFG